jgi:hypothetical protein
MTAERTMNRWRGQREGIRLGLKSRHGNLQSGVPMFDQFFIPKANSNRMRTQLSYRSIDQHIQIIFNSNDNNLIGVIFGRLFFWGGGPPNF